MPFPIRCAQVNSEGRDGQNLYSSQNLCRLENNRSLFHSTLEQIQWGTEAPGQIMKLHKSDCMSPFRLLTKLTFSFSSSSLSPSVSPKKTLSRNFGGVELILVSPVNFCCCCCRFPFCSLPCLVYSQQLTSSYSFIMTHYFSHVFPQKCHCARPPPFFFCPCVSCCLEYILAEEGMPRGVLRAGSRSRAACRTIGGPLIDASSPVLITLQHESAGPV